MELLDVSYGLDCVARPLLLFFSSENPLLWFRYREYDLAHLKLIFKFSIYKVWKSVEYGVSKELDTAYWGFLRVKTTFDIFQNIILILYLEYDVLSPLDTTYWSYNLCGLLVSAGMDTPYLLDGYDVLVFRIIQALVDKKKVIISETSIRSDLKLDDAEGTDCLPTATIFAELERMG
nr:hypothetical protein [Tanacetum cinerariifolium]